MKISVTFPTRKRYDLFVKSINSLIDNCADVNNFEVLVAVDRDDVDTNVKIEKFIADKPNIRLFYFNRQTYAGLAVYSHVLFQNISADTEFVFLWNDDTTIVSKNWDTEILKYHGKFVVLSPKVVNMETYWRTQGVVYPIFPRMFYHIIDIIPHTAWDSWIDTLSKKLGILVNVESIEIWHDRFELTGNNNDEVYHEARAQIAHPNWTRDSESPMVKLLVAHHHMKLDCYLNSPAMAPRVVYPWPAPAPAPAASAQV